MFDDPFRFAADAAQIQCQMQPALDAFRLADAQIRAAQPDPAILEYARRAAAELADFNRRADWLVVMPSTTRDEIRLLRDDACDELRMLREEVVELRQELAQPPVEPVEPPPDDEEWPHTEIKGFRL